MARYQIGDIVVAKNSNKNSGYLKGDTLKVHRHSIYEGDFVAKNLTRPNIKGDGEAYLGDYFRGKIIIDTTEKQLYTIYFLGIPLFTVRKAVDE